MEIKGLVESQKEKSELSFLRLQSFFFILSISRLCIFYINSLNKCLYENKMNGRKGKERKGYEKNVKKTKTI